MLPNDPQAPPTDPGQPLPPQPQKDPHERIDGLRAWLSQLDHTVTVRTWILGLLLLLTLAVAVAALVIGLQVRDQQIDQGEIAQLSDRIEAVETQVAQMQAAASDAIETDFATLVEDVEKLQNQVRNLRDASDATDEELTRLDNEIQDLNDTIGELETRIDELQSEIDAIEQQPDP